MSTFSSKLVQWLERVGSKARVAHCYATNFDVHRNKTLVENSSLFVSGCHNEYWSKEESDHIHNRLFVNGKNTIFFGANFVYWQIRRSRQARRCGKPRTSLDLL